MYGAEIENSWSLTEALTLGLDATRLPKKEFGESASILNISGREFAHAPDLSANLSLGYDRPVTDALAFTARAAAQYTGEIYTNTSNDLMRDAQTLLNPSLGLRALEAPREAPHFQQATPCPMTNP